MDQHQPTSTTSDKRHWNPWTPIPGLHDYRPPTYQDKPHLYTYDPNEAPAHNIIRRIRDATQSASVVAKHALHKAKMTWFNINIAIVGLTAICQYEQTPTVKTTLIAYRNELVSYAKTIQRIVEHLYYIVEEPQQQTFQRLITELHDLLTAEQNPPQPPERIAIDYAFNIGAATNSLISTWEDPLCQEAWRRAWQHHTGTRQL